MPDDKRVFIVDGFVDQRDRLTRLLSEARYDVESYASDATFLATARMDGPCCAVLSMHESDPDGFQFHERIRTRETGIPVIIITDVADIRMCVKAMRAGAVDFLTRPVGRTPLLAAIECALARGVEWHSARQNRTLARERVGLLTARERQVLALVLAGNRNKQIASTLGSQEATIKVHRSRLMHKLMARSLAELFRFGQQLDAVPGAAGAVRRDLGVSDIEASSVRTLAAGD